MAHLYLQSNIHVTLRLDYVLDLPHLGRIILLRSSARQNPSVHVKALLTAVLDAFTRRKKA